MVGYWRISVSLVGMQSSMMAPSWPRKADHIPNTISLLFLNVWFLGFPARRTHGATANQLPFVDFVHERKPVYFFTPVSFGD